MDQKLRAMLDKNREVGLKFHSPESETHSSRRKLCCTEGLKPDPEKIRAINQMPPPTDKEGFLRILGTINYLDKFIGHKADLQGPISQLTQKDLAFVWEKPH